MSEIKEWKEQLESERQLREQMKFDYEALQARIEALENEIADAKALAFNTTLNRTTDDLKDTLDEQLELQYQRFQARIEALEKYSREYIARTDPVLDQLEPLSNENADLKARIEALEEGIENHRHAVWHDRVIDSDEDRKLYRLIERKGADGEK